MYDALFVFAEVNSDTCNWRENSTGGFDLISRRKNSTGHSISTKAVNRLAREDITGQYKFNEGSEEERDAVELAYAHGSCPAYQSGQIIELDGAAGEYDVEFTV